MKLGLRLNPFISLFMFYVSAHTLIPLRSIFCIVCLHDSYCEDTLMIFVSVYNAGLFRKEVGLTEIYEATEDSFLS